MKVNPFYQQLYACGMIAILLSSILRFSPAATSPWIPTPEPPAAAFRAAAPATPSPRAAARMWVVLADRPLVEMQNAGGLPTRAAREHYRERLEAHQETVIREAAALGVPVLARFQDLINALAVQATPEQVERLQKLPGVVRVDPVQDGRIALGESVPWIGAPEAWRSGNTGAGVKIAVLDTGIDYTHAAFGGPGTPAAYTEATTGTQNTVITDTFGGMTFPTLKVAGGYDFIGSAWPNGPLAPDPDPIDDGPAGGHGTHVAGIAAGQEVTDAISGTLVFPGVAPGATLYAYKICSSVGPTCNGIALIQALERAVLTDSVDIINLSIEIPYGGIREDYVTTAAAQNAAELGRLVVAAAGNAGDRPYVVGAPAVARGALSVAASYASNQFAPLIRTTNSLRAEKDYEAAPLEWTPSLHSVIRTWLIPVGTACPGSPLPNLTGRVALIRRGECSATRKAAEVQIHGAAAALIYNTDPNGLPYAEALDPTVLTPINIPVFTLGTRGGNELAAQSELQVTLAPTLTLDLADAIPEISSRGPRFWDNAIKPDLTAPGVAIHSAAMGTGNRALSLSGTSMAAPHVAGALALLRQEFPAAPRQELYNLLLNTAHPTMTLKGLTGMRAPVTRQGAGRIRIGEALDTEVLAWSLAPTDDGKGSLSYGYQILTETWALTKTVQVWYRGTVTTTFDLSFEPVYTDDLDHGVTVVFSPTQLTLTENQSTTVEIGVHIKAADLKPWQLDGGYNGGNGTALTDLEFDGFVQLQGDHPRTRATLPLHLLPRQGTQIQAQPILQPIVAPDIGVSLTLTNTASYTGPADLYAWMGTDPAEESVAANLDLEAIGVRMIYIPDAGNTLEFAVATRAAQTHPGADRFYVKIDTDNNGIPDYYAFNGELTPATGQNIVYLCKLGENYCLAYFFTNTTLNSRIRSLMLPAGALFTDTRRSTFRFSIEAFDAALERVVDRAPDSGEYEFDGAHPLFYPENWSLQVPYGTLSVNVKLDSWQNPETAGQKGLLGFYWNQEPAGQVQTIVVAPQYRLHFPEILRNADGYQRLWLPVVLRRP